MRRLKGSSSRVQGIRIMGVLVLLTWGVFGCVPEGPWNIHLGGTTTDTANCVEPTDDGGYIVAGITTSYGAGESDAWLIKLDAYGTMVWDRCFGGSDKDGANFVQQTTDGGYIIAGYSYNNSAGWADGWLVKTDALGHEEWSRTYGGTASERFYCVRQTSDGGYIAVGSTYTYADWEEVWLVKTDAQGNEEWSRLYGGPYDDAAYEVEQTADGGYVMFGTYDRGMFDGYCYVIKTDAEGDISWEKIFKNGDMASLSAGQQTADGGYVAVGWVDISMNQYLCLDKVFMVKLDAEGNKEWDRIYGGLRLGGACSVHQTDDGGYIMGAWTYLPFQTPEGALIKTDRIGKQEWMRIPETTLENTINYVRQDVDGGYVAAGWCDWYHVPGQSADAWIVKTDAMGNAPQDPM